MRFRLLAFLLLCLAATFSAQAQDGTCSGTLVGHKNVYADGTKVGELQVYWSAAKQKNCARFMHAGPSWGEKRLTGVGLGICRTREDRLCNHPDNDPNADPRKYEFDLDYYSFRAGPVETELKNDGKCMRAAGYIRWKGVMREAVMYGFCD